MAKVRLTTRFIDNVSVDVRTDYHDTLVHGLSLRVSPAPKQKPSNKKLTPPHPRRLGTFLHPRKRWRETAREAGQVSCDGLGKRSCEGAEGHEWYF